MRLDIAQNINIGDRVYNTFKDELVVTGKTEVFNQYGRLDNIKFTVTDRNSITLEYDYIDLYLNGLEDESDEEKSWVDWAANNRGLLEDLDLNIIRHVYVTAFSNGYVYKRNIKYQEMMQK